MGRRPRIDGAGAWHHVMRAFHARANRDGPLFRGRFHSELVGSDAQLIQTSRYIHRNALDIADVTELDDYPWSSYRSYVGSVPPTPWLYTDVLLDMIGGAASYRTFVERDDDLDAA